MPYSDLHKQKFKKNLIVLGIVLGFCAVLLAITIIKMGPVSHGY